MSQILEDAINSVQKSKASFCRFISANDCGTTGSHQSGFYIPKNCIELIFDAPGKKGENKDKFVNIKWQNDFVTNSRFIYYGIGTRNEYRLTRFGKAFPFLNDDNVGDLLILSKIEDDYYEGYVLQTDEDTEDFFATFNITANETNRLINKVEGVNTEELILQCFNKFINTLDKSFPSTTLLSSQARQCYNSVHSLSTKQILENPDSTLLTWLDTEYQLFKAIEVVVYADVMKTPYDNLDALIKFANTILNRRKSRAGKSLEYHLAEVFDRFSLKYDAQGITEDYKKPDFIFPSMNAYHQTSFDQSKLIFLASKTTCKDRWRQIINEANNIPIKHLFTLQQGISKNQLNEMYKENVRLVVPKPYITTFPKEYHDKIMSLDNFVQFTISKQS